MKKWNEKRYNENLENMKVIEKMYVDGDFARIAYRQGLKHLANNVKTLPAYNALQAIIDGEHKPIDMEDFRQEYILFLVENIDAWYYGTYEIDGIQYNGIIFHDDSMAVKFWTTFSRTADSFRHRKKVKKDDRYIMADIVFADMEELTDKYDECPELYHKEIFIDYMHKLNDFIERECNDIQAYYVKCIVSGRMQEMTYKEISAQTGITQKILKYWHKRLKEHKVPEKRTKSNKRINGHIAYNGVDYVNTLDNWLTGYIPKTEEPKAYIHHKVDEISDTKRAYADMPFGMDV